MPHRLIVTVVASLVLSASVASLVVTSAASVDGSSSPARSGYIVASS